MPNERIDQRPAKTSPVAGDKLALTDSQDLQDGKPILKSLDWGNLAAAIEAYLEQEGVLGGAAAWAAFDGRNTPTIIASSNVLSIDKVATGHYRLNFAATLGSASMAAVFGQQRVNAGALPVQVGVGQGESPDFDGTPSAPSAGYTFPDLTFDNARGLSGTVFENGVNIPAGLSGFKLPDTGFTWVSCKVVSFGPNTIGGKSFGVYMSDGGSNYITIGQTHTSPSPSGFRVFANGSSLAEVSTGGGNPLWLRLIVTTGTTISYEYSLNGTSWTSAGTWDPGVAMTQCGFGMFSFTNAGGTFSIDLEDFQTDNIPPGQAPMAEDHLYVESFISGTSGSRSDVPYIAVAVLV